jgi:hypothetical protein
MLPKRSMSYRLGHQRVMQLRSRGTFKRWSLVRGGPVIGGMPLKGTVEP